MPPKPKYEYKVTDPRLAAAIMRYGGSFVKSLADCFLTADPTNKQRLRDAFPDYFQVYYAFAENDLVKPTD